MDGARAGRSRQRERAFRLIVIGHELNDQRSRHRGVVSGRCVNLLVNPIDMLLIPGSR
jgi:hypothetical protein